MKCRYISNGLFFFRKMYHNCNVCAYQFSWRAVMRCSNLYAHTVAVMRLHLSKKKYPLLKWLACIDMKNTYMCVLSTLNSMYDFILYFLKKTSAFVTGWDSWGYLKLHVGQGQSSGQSRLLKSDKRRLTISFQWTCLKFINKNSTVYLLPNFQINADFSLGKEYSIEIFCSI